MFYLCRLTLLIRFLMNWWSITWVKVDFNVLMFDCMYFLPILMLMFLQFSLLRLVIEKLFGLLIRKI